MDLYASGTAVEIRYPSAQTDAQYLADELAARLDELVDGADPFSGLTRAGIPATDINAIYVGREADWAAELGLANIPWWVPGVDFGIKVVSGANCINTNCSGSELHIVARDYPLLLRAVWLALHGLGWRHYMPNGVEGLQELWISRTARTTLTVDVDRVWSGAIDHLLPPIAGGASNRGWSDGSDHETDDFPDGLLEGNLAGAMGDSPAVEADPEGSWLRHMGWTASTHLQTNAAWGAIINFDATHGATLSPWDESSAEGHYTEDHHYLFTDSDAVRAAALAYANDKVAASGLDWVSLSRPDGDIADEWAIDFGSAAFGAKRPVTRQIELANHVATSTAYAGTGIVIQAYGNAGETPDAVWPDPDKVCVVVMEAYRPPGKTAEAVIDDYINDDGTARCPVGLYQYLYSSAWGRGGITNHPGDPRAMVDAVNRVRRLPAVSPSVLTGEAMTDFGFYGLGYYCYMRMVLDVGRVNRDFTLADFNRHRKQFLGDMFPTPAVNAAVWRWYALLLDRVHKPLLSPDLLHGLWSALDDAMNACPVDSEEEKRVAELCKYTRYLDLRNRYEAAEAARDDSETAYDEMMEWQFRCRDSGLVEIYSFFQTPFHPEHHAALGLGSIWDALNAPPGPNRGASGTRPKWTTSPPTVDEFKGVDPGWIADGLANNSPHGLTDSAYSAVLEGGWLTDARARLHDDWNHPLQPYRAHGKMKLWLIPGAPSFECEYRVGAGGAYVEFINQASGAVDAEFAVTENTLLAATLTEGQLYEVRLTTYATSEQMSLNWWSSTAVRHYLSFDPGREGDPCGLSGNDRSWYFLVPDGVGEIHFYASIAERLQLFLPDGAGGEVEDITFNPMPRAYQTHSVAGAGRRVVRIAGIHNNEIGFWLLNCPNLFALHPEELLKPSDA